MTFTEGRGNTHHVLGYFGKQENKLSPDIKINLLYISIKIEVLRIREILKEIG